MVIVFGVFFTPNENSDNTDNTLLIEERLVWRPRQPIQFTSQIFLMTLVKALASYLQTID
jgi:hypothetical protein